MPHISDPRWKVARDLDEPPERPDGPDVQEMVDDAISNMGSDIADLARAAIKKVQGEMDQRAEDFENMLAHTDARNLKVMAAVCKKFRSELELLDDEISEHIWKLIKPVEQQAKGKFPKY